MNKMADEYMYGMSNQGGDGFWNEEERYKESQSNMRELKNIDTL